MKVMMIGAKQHHHKIHRVRSHGRGSISKMKEAVILPGPRVKIVDTPVPDINDDQVLIKVVVSGSNPKDWKVPETAAKVNLDGPLFEKFERIRNGINQGDDVAGVVERVGENVVEFKPGDRVAAFHEMQTPGGSYAEYAVAWSHTTFHLPKHTSFEEAATIPLAGLTAAIALYEHLHLPFPWSPASATSIPIPFFIYGASTAVGAFAIKIAQRSNIHPLIAVAGRGIPYVQTLLDPSKGDVAIDYRNGPEETIRHIQTHLQSFVDGLGDDYTLPIQFNHALDAVVVPHSMQVLRSVMAPEGQVNFVLPHSHDVKPAVATNTVVGGAHGTGPNNSTADSRELAFLFCRWFTRGLELGWFCGHPFQVRKGGLDGVEQALKDLRDNKASAVKYVFRLADTPGVCK